MATEPLRVRIRGWWSAVLFPLVPPGVDQPAVCMCGHYLYATHGKNGCTARAYDQWLHFGPIRISLKCRCKIREITFRTGIGGIGIAEVRKANGYDFGGPH